MLEISELVLLIFTCILTIVNVFLFLLIVRQLALRRKRNHPNYIALRFFHIFVCTFTSCIIAMNASVLLISNETLYYALQGQLYWMYKFFGLGVTAGTILMRCASIGLIIERLFATFLASTYETKHRRVWIGCMVMICSFSIGVVISVLYHTKVYGFWTHVAIFTCFDTTNVLGLILLTQKNKQLRRLNTRSDIILSERYQLTENLKTLYDLRPMLISQSIIMVLASGSGLLTTKYLGTRFFVDWVFYTMMNFSVTVLFTVALMLRPLRSKYIRRQVANNGGVRNVFGKLLEAQQSPNEYFNHLQWQWK